MGAPPKFIATNLAHPKGLLGRLACFLMNRHNASMNAFACRSLATGPGDRVLEIGFGGGSNLSTLIPQVQHFTGVDISEDAVAWAAARYSAAVKGRRASFVKGEAASLPSGDAEFTKVLTVNTVYFWPSLDDGFAEIRRVLRPGGTVFVGFLPASAMAPLGYPSELWTMRSIDDVRDALDRSGFADIATLCPATNHAWVVISARCPTTA